ncbi:MAG TPA: ABC transporter permease, partial [Chthoniobacterales bacterium]|nr:ABC transporter permease [Chthoniobacterales bacterium]
AIFSLIDSVLLKPLPFPHPDRLVRITQPDQNDLGKNIDYPDYIDIVRSQHTFDVIAVAGWDGIDLSGDGKPEHLNAVFVSPSAFQVTALPVALGRVFTDQENVPNGPLLVVLSEKFWRAHFHSDPGILGKNLTLAEHSFQVIGVVPTQTADWGPPGADVYLPAHALATLGYMAIQRGYPLEMRDVHRFDCYGRMKSGVTITQAQQDLEIIHDNLLVRYPDTNRGYGIRVSSLLDSMVTDYSATTWLLAAAVDCLLLIATGNVANLLFARGLQRRRELMVRSLLGASRLQLVRQLLGETILLALFGGIIGLLFSFCAVGIIKQVLPATLYRFQDLSIDLPALLFVLAVTILVAILSGVVPAWGMSEVQLAPGLKDEAGRGGTTGTQHHRVQAILVSLQVALACILMIGAGLLMRSFLAAQNASLGFNPHQVLTMAISLSSAKYEFDGVRTRNFWDRLLDKVRRLPRVTRAAVNDGPPMKWEWEVLFPFTIDGETDPGAGRRPLLGFQQISLDYFHTLEIPILQGRDFDLNDTVDKPNVTIVDDALAQRFYPGQSAIGKTISVLSEEGTKHCTIVGVVPHLQHTSPGRPANPFQAYFPYTQWNYDFEILIVKSNTDPAILVPMIRDAVASIDLAVPVSDVGTYDSVVAEKFVTRRLSAFVVTLFSGAALSLSAVGLYGILAYSVGQRTREIGIRIALGAQGGNILKLVTERGFQIVGIGLLAGLTLGLVAAYLIRGLLYGVSPIDPVSFGASFLFLGAATALACLLPAIRAIRINPITALRE